MGWGIGIGIGWPNASASNQSQMVYFTIVDVCGGGAYNPGTTQLVDNSTYQTGDGVNFNNGGGYIGRVILGTSTLIPGSYTYNISGPAYIGCEE